MSSIVITLKSNRTSTDLANRLQVASGNPQQEMQRLSSYFASLASGIESAVATVALSSTSPVAASGTVTLTYASVANNDTVTVAGVTLTCVTGTPTGAQFKKVTDGPTTATNLAALINSNATTSLVVTASASSSFVTLTANQPGVVGNQIPLATSNGTGFALSAATLASGTGGATQAGTTYSRGL